MTKFEIRDVSGNWLRAQFAASGVDPEDELACGLLLAKEVRDRKLPGDASRYYLKAYHPRKGWQQHRVGGG